MSIALRMIILSFFVTSAVPAATDTRVTFTLKTADKSGAALTQARSYFVYRPDNLPKSAPVPMVLVMQNRAPFFQPTADKAGFVVVACNFTGNSLGNVWNNHNPRLTGWEDFDYLCAVIDRVKAAENCHDAFICGLSKGGHMSYAFACERPDRIRAACSVDEFMGLTSNIPTAPLPILALQGTLDTNVPYTMSKNSVDAWRAMNGLMDAIAETTYESSPLLPGRVTQTTWRSGNAGTQVAFVTVIGGDHRWPVPGVQTGYDSPAAVWAFFSQFLTSTQPAPKIVSAPTDNIQLAGQPASFRVGATGTPPLRYQWQKNGANLPGATTNWLTVHDMAMADDGATFRAIVTNAAGSVVSSSARLTVQAVPADPVITQQTSDQSVVAGKPVRFAVAAQGAGQLRYQWRKNGMTLVDATTSTLTLPSAITADSGATFSVLVSSTTGQVNSVAAALTVASAPGAPVIVSNPERVRVSVGETGKFSVSATSRTPMTYQWQRGPFTGNMVDIRGATQSTYKTPPGKLQDHHTLFRCIVVNAAGPTVSASEMLFVTAPAK